MIDREDELLSVKYRIEKSSMKQQKLENRLVSISDELKASKRNSLIYMIFFVAVILVMGTTMYFLNTQKIVPFDVVDQENGDAVLQIKKINDSLERELIDLKSDIDAYRQTLLQFNDKNDGQEHVVKTVSDSLVESKPISKFDKVYCFIKNVFRSGDVIFIEADYIEYLEGKKAVEKAKENGVAEFDINTSGDTLYFLYNNYYVNNNNPKIRRLELDDRVSIQDINQISKGFPLKAFQKIIADNPIMILEVKNGIVYKITKQKLP